MIQPIVLNPCVLPNLSVLPFTDQIPGYNLDQTTNLFVYDSCFPFKDSENLKIAMILASHMILSHVYERTLCASIGLCDSTRFLSSFNEKFVISVIRSWEECGSAHALSGVNRDPKTRRTIEINPFFFLNGDFSAKDQQSKMNLILFLATIIVHEVSIILKYLLSPPSLDGNDTASLELSFSSTSMASTDVEEDIGEVLEFQLFGGHLEYVPERNEKNHYFLGSMEKLFLIVLHGGKEYCRTVKCISSFFKKETFATIQGWRLPVGESLIPLEIADKAVLHGTIRKRFAFIE
jgi:hypothetical protein